MPFTLSHPAAVLPLVRPLRRLGVASALAVGSVTPDLPYYLAAEWTRDSTHTLASVLWFAVPAGLAVWLVLQHLVKAPALFLLPRPFRARIDPGPVPLGPGVPLALALGALTHVLWDAFTHETGAAVRGLPVLQPLVADGIGVPLWTYRILQHGSTLLGAAAIAWWVRAWLRRTPERRPVPATGLPAAWRTPLRAAALGGPALVGLAVGFAWAPPAARPEALAFFAMHVVVAGLSSAAALLVGLGVLARLRRTPAEA